MAYASKVLLVLVVGVLLLAPALAKYSLIVKWKVPLYPLDKPGRLGNYQVMADIDNDGKMEIPVMIAVGRPGPLPNKTIALVNSDGTIRWEINKYVVGVAQLAVGDITGDSSKEIVFQSNKEFGGRGWVRVHAYDSEGKELWAVNETTGNQPLLSCVTIADLDGDGKGEVLAPDMFGNIDCLDGDGKLIWHYAGKEPIGFINPSVGDVDGDGLPEVVVPTLFNLTILDGRTGEILFRNTTSGGVRLGGATGGAALVNLDGKPGKEIVVDTGGRIVCVNGTGSLVWNFSESWPGGSQSQVVVGDVTWDGFPEVFFGTNNNTMTALTFTGIYDGKGRQVWRRLWEWKGPKGSKFGAQGSEAIADIDGDGVQEVIWTSWDGNLYVADATTGVIKSTYTFPNPSIGFASPMVGDVDGDGRLDIVVAAGDNVLYCLAAPSATTGKAVWPLWKYDAGNTGDFGLPISEGFLSAVFALVGIAYGILRGRTKVYS